LATERAGVEVGLGKAHGRDLRIREDRARHQALLQRGNGIAQGVPHRDAPLHGGDRGEHEHAGAVAGGVDAPVRRAGHAVDLNEAALIGLDADGSKVEVVGVRQRADGHEHVRAGDGRARAQGHLDTLVRSTRGDRA
jgi:hypothetical protein